MSKKVALIGESMLELSRQSRELSSGNLSMNLSYGGDTLNSAVYMARLGVNVDYVTALGDDAMSTWMIQQWRGENVGCELIERIPDSVPGIYLVSVDDSGERSFSYWRDSAPARHLFDDQKKSENLFTKLKEYDWLCLSGITLAIYKESSRQRLFDLITRYRVAGGKVLFDSNYRPKLWESVASAQAAYQSMYQLTDLALPTIEDEQALFGDNDKIDIIKRIKTWGVSEIVLKMGGTGCQVVCNDKSELVASHKVDVIDTTSAGDSFNAGYLAARLKGSSSKEAASEGHNLASIVIQHRGAIIPYSSMPTKVGRSIQKA